MQPVLLRSAGVVGLAGAIVAVISSQALFGGTGPSSGQPPSAAQSAAAVAVVRIPPSAELVAPAAGVFERSPDFIAAPAAPPRVEADRNEAGAAPEVTASLAASPDPRPESAPATPPAHAPAPAAPVSAPAADGAHEAPEENSGEASEVWPDEAVDCPRDWVAVQNPGDAPADCREAGTESSEVAALGAEQGALDEAAMERAAELGGLEFAPRIPKVRPDPPPQRRRTARRTARADWPADPPPDCGKKWAKWRYVNNVPTWYCR